MSLNEFLLVFAFILILMDFFILSDALTLIAYLIFTYVFSEQFEVHFLYQILIGITFYPLVVTFHYKVWKNFIKNILDIYIAKDMHITGINQLKGKTGIVKIINGKKRAEVNGEFYEFYRNIDLLENSEFIVDYVKDEKVIVKEDKVVAKYIVKDSTSMHPPFDNNITFEKEEV